ncbi:MAG: prepilin peptidase [Actinomycetes bacterium]
MVQLVIDGVQYSNTYLVPLVVSLGLVFGSFNSVLVGRIPDRENINGRSKCPKCGTQLAARDNIPVLGYLMLRGKCRNCKNPISSRYLLLEMCTAAAMFIPLFRFQGYFVIAAWESFIIFGIALIAIDLEHHRLPDLLTGPLFLSGAIFLGIDAFKNHHTSQLFHALLYGFSACAIFYSIHILSKGGMGMGDVKLAASMGLFSGYVSATAVYVSAMTGFALGSLVGVSLMVAKKATRKTAVPFGPFMIVGTVLSLWITPVINQVRGFN